MPSAASSAGLTRARLVVLAGLCAVSVANIYYAQPLLERIGADLSIPVGQVGWVVAIGQAGYLAGLSALVPLGDWVNRRVLMAVQLVMTGAGTAVAAASASAIGLFAGIGIAGVFSVVVQVAVAYTAALSGPGERGRNIGFVTSGVVNGRASPVTVIALTLLIASWWFTGQAGHSLWLAAAGAVVLDFSVQAVHVTSQNLIVAERPQSSSRIIGSYMLCYSLGSALGAVTTAAVYQRAGWPAAAALGACYAAAALAVWTLDRLTPGPGVIRLPPRLGKGRSPGSSGGESGTSPGSGAGWPR